MTIRTKPIEKCHYRLLLLVAVTILIVAPFGIIDSAKGASKVTKDAFAAVASCKPQREIRTNIPTAAVQRIYCSLKGKRLLWLVQADGNARPAVLPVATLATV
jgi:hypothetical protein